MALVEVEENELADYKKVTGVMQRLLSSPKTRRQILQAQKELNPDLSIPELDVSAPVLEEMKAIKEQLASEKTEREKEKADRDNEKRLAALQHQWDTGRTKLRAAGYTDEGLTALETFMEEKGLADHEIAAAAFEKLHPPEEPVKAVGGNRFDIFQQETQANDAFKALLENPDNDSALNKMVNDTLREVRGR